MIAHQIEFRWAFDETGVPTPIQRAQRGAHYHCPVCGDTLTAKMGQLLQHHFAHEVMTECTPEAVDQAALRRLIALRIREALTLAQPLKLGYRCRYCGSDHKADLLEGVAAVEEDQTINDDPLDVILRAPDEKIRGVVIIHNMPLFHSESSKPLWDFPAFEITIPLTVLESFIEGDPNSLGWLRQGVIVNAPCPVWQSAGEIVRDGSLTREALLTAVMKAGKLALPVEKINGLRDMIRLNGSIHWLSLERWRELVGGTLSRMGAGLEIIGQEIHQTSGEIISLYYITLNSTAAVAGMWFMPGETNAPRIDERFRMRRATALDIAQMLIMR